MANEIMTDEEIATEAVELHDPTPPPEPAGGNPWNRHGFTSGAVPDLPTFAMPDADVSFVGHPGQIVELMAAFCLAQGEFPAIPKTRTVKIQSAKGNYSFDYAPLETIHAATRPCLVRHGLAILQPYSERQNDAVLYTVLAHKSGGMLISRSTFLRGHDIKDFGAQLTYRRRYSEGAMLDVAADADADDMPTRPEEAGADAGPRQREPKPAGRAPKPAATSAAPAPRAEAPATPQQPTSPAPQPTAAQPAPTPPTQETPKSTPPPARVVEIEKVSAEQSSEIRNHGRRLGWTQPQLVGHLMQTCGIPAANLTYITAEKWLEKLRTTMPAVVAGEQP
jgi:hypothetical protein